MVFLDSPGGPHEVTGLCKRQEESASEGRAGRQGKQRLEEDSLKTGQGATN